MIEPAVLLESLMAEKAKCSTHALARLVGGDPLPFRSNTKRSQTKTSSRDTRYVAVLLVQRRIVCSRAIGYETGVGIGLVPKVLKGSTLEVFEKLLVLACEFVCRLLKRSARRY